MKYPHAIAETKVEPLWKPKTRSELRVGMFRHRRERATINAAWTRETTWASQLLRVFLLALPYETGKRILLITGDMVWCRVKKNRAEMTMMSE